MRQEAQTFGVSAATFDAATRGLEPDLSLPDLVVPGRPETPPRGQPEFVQTPAEYLKEATIDRLASQGRKLAEEHRAPLARIGQAFGVPPEIIMAIWGRETAFGQYKLPHNAIRVLATQAFAGKRKEQFRHEFLLALRMIEEGHAKPADMRSSWAGAMGHTQFLPSDFYNYAVDFDGDGRRDIWRSVPDALASAAKQLVDKGWERGSQWGYEVRLPRAIDCSMAEPDVTMPIAEWIAHGFVPAHDRRLTEGELTKRASVVLPAGIYGPGFLAPKNYFVLKAYNFSDLYVLFVGHLADRLGAAQSFATPWRPLAQLPSAHIEELQRRLSAAGYYRDKIDGKAGMKTRSALGAYQKAHGLKLDCWPDPAVLAHLRRTTAER
jgi:lytic murein transglycosylase